MILDAAEFSPPHPGRPPSRPHQTDAKQTTTTSTKSNTVLSIILPVYAVGIVLYLLFTLTKVATGKRSGKIASRDDHLREYYRNFHYDPQKGRFTMGNGSSDEESDENSNVLRSKNNSKNKAKKGTFDWASAYGDPTTSHLYRSQNSLPKDLAYLLKRVDEKNITDEELPRLRQRLEETEAELARVLEAMKLIAQEEEMMQEKVEVQPESDESDVIVDVFPEPVECTNLEMKPAKDTANVKNRKKKFKEPDNDSNDKNSGIVFENLSVSNKVQKQVGQKKGKVNKKKKS
ncbi:hypothetical protein Ciccas_008736 [Cichlidogyrus casuarinus]|uniref:Resistance to inhibitors of cholinesterase protein 3 N-terminal domain-containing protein n=1 Tax=Cichlidogyrus casuarinus TaxID=1844966 RepID=A0ABD2Q1S3_9PLAT